MIISKVKIKIIVEIMCGSRSKGKSCVIRRKTKIYQTIKGLIILFIKLQFSIRCNQTFKPLRTSTSKHLPQTQPQFPTVNWPCHSHHLDIFVSSWYTSWFQTCTCRGLCIWSSQVQAYVFVRPGGYWSITKEAFVILISYSDFLEDEVDVCTREKF